VRWCVYGTEMNLPVDFERKDPLAAVGLGKCDDPRHRVASV
jgi:hypothetical protein